MKASLKTKNFPDVQERKDNRGIALAKAGIRGIVLPFMIFDKVKGMQHVTARINFYTTIPENFESARINDIAAILNVYSKKVITGKMLLEMLREAKSNKEKVFLEIGFTYFIDKKTPATHIVAPMNYECKFIASLTEVFDLILEAKVPVTTLCPHGKKLTGCSSHNQRSFVTIRASGDVWFDDIINIAEESASGELFTILKSADEKITAQKSYNNPKLAEDVVRDAAAKMKHDSRITRFYVKSEDLESNRNYNVVASVSSDAAVI